MLAWKKTEFYAPLSNEEKAIFKKNQPSPMAVELRELRSSGAIRELHITYK